MLGRDPFYFSLLRKYVAIFGTLFNEIQIIRTDPAGATQELVKVPITYGPKEKTLARWFGDPNIDRKAEVSLPRMSFEMTGITHDSSGKRRLGSIQQITIANDDGSYSRQFTPVPYELEFTLWVYAGFVEDGNKIVEQIMPFFTPEFTVQAELIPEMDVHMDVPTSLISIQSQDDYQGPVKDRRVLIWTITFKMKVWFYAPVMTAAIIKFANVTFYDATRFDDITDAVGNTVPLDRVTVQPGLTANGQPTSNVAESIPYLEINVDDDWGYCVTIYGNLSSTEPTGGADEPVDP